MKRRIVIVSNKSWETDPLVGVLTNIEARPKDIKFASSVPKVTVTRLDNTSIEISARLCLDFSDAAVELWCIQDLMDPKASLSSSQEKARVLPSVYNNGPPPALVIAFGTAALPGVLSYNGSVAVGNKVFVHNPFAQNPNEKSNWTHRDFEKLLSDASPHPVIAYLDHKQRLSVDSRLLSPPMYPAHPPSIMPSIESVALCSVNVTDSNDYSWVDPEAMQALRATGATEPVGSVETTHGVIRLVMPSEQFLFVSGIANRLGYFGLEVAPRLYAQNFVAAHNAGVALAWMLPIVAA